MGGLAGGEIAINGLERTLTDVLVQIQTLEGISITHRLTSDTARFVVPEKPEPYEVALTYTVLGFEHIFEGPDHLLFVFGLLLIVGRRWMLVKTITAFTLAHSITLALATLGHASAPPPFVETVIALSIMLLGPEVVRVSRQETSFTIRHPWLVAFAFGLLHGFGFAGALGELGLPQGHIPLSLLMFNVGVELGQLTFVFVVLIVCLVAKRLGLSWPKPLRLFPAYVVGSCGALWFIERVIGLW